MFRRLGIEHMIPTICFLLQEYNLEGRSALRDALWLDQDFTRLMEMNEGVRVRMEFGTHFNSGIQVSESMLCIWMR